MKPYPAYKDSGIEWIGEIPEHWVIRRIGGNASLLTGFAFESEKFSYNDEHIKLLRGDNVTTGELRWGDKKRHWPEFSKDLERFLLESNDIVIGMDGSKVGKNYAMVKEEDLPLILVQRVARIRCMQSLIPRFAYYFISNSMFSYYVDTTMTNTAVPHITLKNIRDYPICFPPLPEQQSIAEFLNNKTSQIDTLIEKKQKQIELLKEERTAIINQAVTKGLNPDVPMKDSGIEWLGEVPEHWGIARLKIIAKIKYGLGQPPRELENGLPLIRATNISQGKINPQDLLYVDPNDVPHERDPILKENDIIVVRSGAYTGDSAIIPKTYEGAVSGYDMVVRTQKANPEYIAYSLLSHSVLHNQIDLCKFRAAQPHLNAEELGNTLHILPPFEEQKTIVDYINKSNKKMGLIELKAESEINLLQEYRTALISNAVTGKIDVREYHGNST